MSNDGITWKNDRVRLIDLHPWGQNPRQSSQRQAERIADSHRLFGQPEVLAVGPNNELYNGHQRRAAWLAEYGENFEVDIRRSSRVLTEDERVALLAMLHAGATGSWDWDQVANLDGEILKGFGFDEELLVGMRNDSFALAEFLASDGDGGIDFSEFGKVSGPNIMYRVVIAGLTLPEAEALAATIENSKVEQYRE